MEVASRVGSALAVGVGSGVAEGASVGSTVSVGSGGGVGLSSTGASTGAFPLRLVLLDELQETRLASRKISQMVLVILCIKRESIR